MKKEHFLSIIDLPTRGVNKSTSLNQDIISQIFPKTERGKALGVLAAAVALGTMLGPALGGLIRSKLQWNYIFLVNFPVGVMAFFFGLKINNSSGPGSVYY